MGIDEFIEMVIPEIEKMDGDEAFLYVLNHKRCPQPLVDEMLKELFLSYLKSDKE